MEDQIVSKVTLLTKLRRLNRLCLGTPDSDETRSLALKRGVDRTSVELSITRCDIVFIPEDIAWCTAGDGGQA